MRQSTAVLHDFVIDSVIMAPTLATIKALIEEQSRDFLTEIKSLKEEIASLKHELAGIRELHKNAPCYNDHDLPLDATASVNSSTCNFAEVVRKSVQAVITDENCKKM